MLELSCPSCGAAVQFKSKVSVFAVCSYCKSTLVRDDMNLESIGRMAELQDDITPIQIGTTGQFEGDRFEVIGRMRVAYSDGAWNEWHIIFPDGETGWLPEAQGFYAVCVPVSDKIHRSQIQKAKPGDSVGLSGRVYEIEDIKRVYCLYSEGELPFNAPASRRSTSIDLVGQNAEMATIELAEDEVRSFVGLYKEFDELKFNNLRRLDGWKL